MNELSKLIKAAANNNTPPPDYFQSFLPAYRSYHKRQNVKRTIYKICTAITLIVVACITLVSINRNELDIQTASGTEMSNHHTQHGKVVVFEGNVSEVTEFIKNHVQQKTDTISLKEYFKGDDVWGVYVPGEEKFRYYYQCLGKGRYTVFVVNE